MDVVEAGQGEVARNVANPLLVGTVGVTEGQGAPGARDEDFAGGLAASAALAVAGVVRTDRRAERDAAVGLAGHVDAEADAGNRMQVFVAVQRAVVVDVVAETQAGVAEQRDARVRGRRHAANRERGESGRGEENLLHLVSPCFLSETQTQIRVARISEDVFTNQGGQGQANGDGQPLCVKG